MAKLVGHAMASISQDLTAVDSSQRNELGAVVQDKAGNEYVYLAGVASTAAGDWVLYNHVSAADLYLTARLINTPLAGQVAMAMGANTAATTFGWYQVRGRATGANIATDAAADGKVISESGTAGRAATGATTTKNIFGAVCIGASAANVGIAFICYPFCFNSATI